MNKMLLAGLLLLTLVTAHAAAPVVSNVRSVQRAGTQLVDIDYDVADADSAMLIVSIAVSTNGGASYTLPATSFTGALGVGVTPGANKHITWNAGTDWPNKFSANVRFRITAIDDITPDSMVLIPASSFTMGDTFGEGGSNELPLHAVYISAFYMDRHEVTKALWDDVYNWAVTHGYSFVNAGSGKAANHPVQSINWHDTVKWCNARSEKEGRVPAYYTNTSQTTVYRTGEINVQNDWVKWNAGYRLPTEAEWEKSARGGLNGRRFPWPDADNITHARANYYAQYPWIYDLSYPIGFHPSFVTGGPPHTSPVGYFAPNGYGLYDMAGNVWEWCWDWSGLYSSSLQTDPRGPTSGSLRAPRGGGWYGSGAFDCRLAARNGSSPASRFESFGFRSVLPPTDIPIITAHPQAQRIRRGLTATLSVTATGAMPLIFQWQKNGINIPGATAAGLVLTNIQLAQEGTYTVIISNSAGIVTSLGAFLDVYTGGGIEEI